MKERLILPTWMPCEAPEVDTMFSLRVGPPTTRKGVHNYHLAYDETKQFARGLNLGLVVQALEHHLHATVGNIARDRVFIHAGVVGWRGYAILLPAEAGAGTSTLVKALVELGATYYSDEFALLDEEGRVWPYPRDLILRHNERISAAQLGYWQSLPLPLGCVLKTNYVAGKTWRPSKVGTGRGCLSLLKHTVSMLRDPQRAMRVIPRSGRCALFLQGARGEALQAAESLLRRVSKHLSLS